MNSHENISASAWALSQHTDTSKNTKATIKCCYALHSYLGNHLHLLALYTMASILQKWRYVNSLKTACGYPCGRIINNHAILWLYGISLYRCMLGECLAGKLYNTMDTLPSDGSLLCSLALPVQLSLQTGLGHTQVVDVHQQQVCQPWAQLQDVWTIFWCHSQTPAQTQCQTAATCQLVDHIHCRAHL